MQIEVKPEFQDFCEKRKIVTFGDYTSYFTNVKNLPENVVSISICGKLPINGKVFSLINQRLKFGFSSNGKKQEIMIFTLIILIKKYYLNQIQIKFGMSLEKCLDIFRFLLFVMRSKMISAIGIQFQHGSENGYEIKGFKS